MHRFTERRDSLRMLVYCEIYCKPPQSEELIKAICTSVSGSGISFTCAQPFETGDVVQVKIPSIAEILQEINFLITIIRCQAIEKGNFIIGAQIHLPEQEQ